MCNPTLRLKALAPLFLLLCLLIPPRAATAAETAPPSALSAPVAQAGCTNDAALVSDVTYPDGSTVQSRTAFVKTWRVRNTGSCNWTTSYRLVFEDGHRVGGPASVRLARAVAPGATVDLSVRFVAPAQPGQYVGYWKLNDAGWNPFGDLLRLDVTVLGNLTTSSLPPELAFGIGGGGGGCNELMPDEVYIAPPDPIEIGDAQETEWQCAQNLAPCTPVYATLTDPSGTSYSSYSFSDPGGYLFVETIWDVGTVAGQWQLDVQADSQSWQFPVDVSSVAGRSRQEPRLTVSAQNPLRAFAPHDPLLGSASGFVYGEWFEVVGEHFAPWTSIPVGLYQMYTGIDSSTRVAAWTADTDENGRFSLWLQVEPTWPETVLGLVALPDASGIRYSGSAPEALAPYAFLNIMTQPIVQVGRFDDGTAHGPTREEMAQACLNRAYIPSGSFTMGSSEDDIWRTVDECNRSEGDCQYTWFDGEAPQRQAWTGAFEMAIWETSNRQYRLCAEAGWCAPPGQAIGDDNLAPSAQTWADERPVVGVTLFDAQNFCAWLGGRLPTEEEWEKAARGSDDARRYPWGDDYVEGRANLWSASPVSVYDMLDWEGASPYGVMHLAGNAFEWTASEVGGKYVLRGGSWATWPFRGRVSDRGTKLEPGFANYDIGFRCVWDAE